MGHTVSLERCAFLEGMDQLLVIVIVIERVDDVPDMIDTGLTFSNEPISYPATANTAMSPYSAPTKPYAFPSPSKSVVENR
jgi:hypothetical protein